MVDMDVVMPRIQIFMSTHFDKEKLKRAASRALSGASSDSDSDDDANTTADSSSVVSSLEGVDFSTDVLPLSGAWAALADGARDVKGLRGTLPAHFTGLATPEKNPMSMQLTHEEVVVGCADGTI